MRSLVTGRLAVLVASAVLGVPWAGSAGAAVHAPLQARTLSVTRAHQVTVPGTRLWVKRYNGPGNGADVADDVAVSPDGATVFVTGQSTGAFSSTDYLTVAYSAVTGTRLWAKRYHGPGAGQNGAVSVAVSPDGSALFVTGTSAGPSGSGQDYATVAYRSSDGTQLWAARFNGPASGDDFATAVSVARDGTAVFVTGTSFDNADGTSNMATVAYRSTDGHQLWVQTWAPASCCNYGGTAVVSPGGNRVFVTGQVQSQAVTAEYGTVAYNATTGARLWEQRYAGRGPTSIAVSPDLSTVYVTGTSHYDYGTLAYSARTGARLWARLYGGRRSVERASSVTVSPGGTVIVTGSRQPDGSTAGDYATVAYSPGGSQLWSRRYSGPGNRYDVSNAVAALGNGRVYVTGMSWGGSATGYDYATVSYNVRTGAMLWVRRYSGPGRRADSATALAARDHRLFVTGGSAGSTSGDDYATIAYTG